MSDQPQSGVPPTTIDPAQASQAQPPAQPELGDIDVDLTGGGAGAGGLAGLARKFSKPAPPPKEKAAMRIGLTLTIIFGVAIFFTIWEGFRVIFFSMDQPDHTKTLISEAVVPLLEKIATFFTTVFSPLLAFILGYYFGQGQAVQKADESSQS